MKTIARLIAIVCFASCIFHGVAFGQEEKAPHEKSEMLTARVLVLDPDGNPVEGATVFPSGIRTKTEPGSHWGWDFNRFGPLPNIVTNENGIAAVPYPKYVTEKLETGVMTWSVEHPDFVRFRSDRSVADDPAEVSLKRGFRIAVTAVNGQTGESIKNDLYAVSAVYGRKNWKLHENGTLVSPVFDYQESSFRVVQISEGRPILFSEFIDAEPGDKSRVLLHDIKLFPGTRVEGKLADNISRPIEGGYVSAWVITRPTPAEGNSSKRLYWMDTTPIAADGSFVFESMPTGDVVQMIPICNGWVPKNPPKEQVAIFYPEAVRLLGLRATLPQLAKLEGAKILPVLEMEPAAKCQILVKDPDGKPLVGAEVAMWPNQNWFDSGSQILGESARTATQLAKTTQTTNVWSAGKRYRATTDENGIALIENLPANRTEPVSVMHDEFELPISGNERSVTVDLKPNKATEIEVQLQKKGTELLGENKNGDSGDQ